MSSANQQIDQLVAYARKAADVFKTSGSSPTRCRKGSGSRLLPNKSKTEQANPII